jgi:hypothetical protein
MRTVVVVWKRTMHALRRESSRDLPRGVLTSSRFAMTTLDHARRHGALRRAAQAEKRRLQAAWTMTLALHGVLFRDLDLRQFYSW